MTEPTSAQVVALIPAAGRGSRFSSSTSKGLLEANGVRFIERIASVLLESQLVSRMIVAVTDSEKEAFADCDYGSLKVEFVTGGATRQESVRAGVEFLSESGFDPHGIVLIHDVARPLVSTALVRAAIEAARKYRAVTCVVPVTDTIRKRTGEGSVQLNRSELVAVQTPQCFEFELLLRAHRENRVEATDDAGLVEQISPVTLINGENSNIKVTYPFELVLAEHLLSSHLDGKKD